MFSLPIRWQIRQTTLTTIELVTVCGVGRAAFLDAAHGGAERQNGPMSPVPASLSRRPLPPIEVRRYRDAYGRGLQQAILRDGDDLAVALAANELTRGWVPLVVLLHGTVLADLDRPRDAARYLEQGLAMLPGTLAATEIGTGDHFVLLLVEQLFALARIDEVAAHLEPLLLPDRPLETRFGALRAQARLAVWHGRYEEAHHYLNTAAGVAGRARSNFFAALVDADRAMLLVTQGSSFEGGAVAERVLPALLRPGRSPRQRWANAEGAACALTIARYAAGGHDLFTAGRYLAMAEPVVAGTGRRALAGLAALARAAYAREVLDADGAERSLQLARAMFSAVPSPLGLAVTELDQARLAAGRGLLAAARPLAKRAAGQLFELRTARELADARALVAWIDACAPDPMRTAATRPDASSDHPVAS